MSNMTRNSPIEDELDVIRLDIYEKTKSMTVSEITEYIKTQIAPTVKKFNVPLSHKTNPVSHSGNDAVI